MKKLQQLTKEINDLTLKIEQEYPELYQYLDENPIPLPEQDHEGIDTKNFSDYLDSLKALLEHYLESRQVSKN